MQHIRPVEPALLAIVRALEGQPTRDAARPVRMRVEGLATPNLQDVSFELHEGEVLGLTGLVGSGYDEVVYALYGATPALAGALTLDGRRIELAGITARSAMRLGMALVPADRQRDGSVASLPATDNLNLLGSTASSAVAACDAARWIAAPAR